MQAGLSLTWSETPNKNTKMSSLKSSGNIQEKEEVPDSSVSNNRFSSETLNEQLAMNAREKQDSQTND